MTNYAKNFKELVFEFFINIINKNRDTRRMVERRKDKKKFILIKSGIQIRPGSNRVSEIRILGLYPGRNHITFLGIRKIVYPNFGSLSTWYPILNTPNLLGAPLNECILLVDFNLRDK